ncbi:mitochondrial carrier protein [Ditylenchus destructor]|nr:mitochondrial carrier protein [Ditylenchus destructor]
MKTDGTLQKQAKSSQYVISSFISGALAAALAKTVIAPLDNTKLAFQISTSKKYSLNAALSFVRDTYHNYGFTALFRGNSAQMARIMPFAAFKFGSFEVYNKLLHVDEHGYGLLCVRELDSMEKVLLRHTGRTDRYLHYLSLGQSQSSVSHHEGVQESY